MTPTPNNAPAPVRTYAYFIGGPRDGEPVEQELLRSGPTITVAVPEPMRAYFTPGGGDLPKEMHATTHVYREAPRMRVGEKAVFRLFISESFGLGDSLNSIVDVLCTAMDHRRYARKPR